MDVEKGLWMARWKKDLAGRGKGESCKARHGKGLQVGFVFGKRTHGKKACARGREDRNGPSEESRGENMRLK